MNGMGSVMNVMNDKHLEARVMKQQVGVHNVVPLVASETIKKEV